MRKHLALAILSTLFALVLHAQTKEVTGSVTDSTGAPVPGASINVKGKKGGASAGVDGSFRITVPEGSTLIVSAVGFTPREVSVKGTNSVYVKLFTVRNSLSEVVVTALGIKREKRSLGYATQTVGADQLNTTGTGNALNELSGKASGLTVINSAGDPGAGTFVLLRGITSITGNNQPLMVVDGVPIDNSANNFDPQFNGFQAGGAGADLLGSVQPTNRGVDLNPNDIESITLLKGPAATALYGIQAASGAMVITTKKGAGGRKSSVSINSSANFDKVSQLPPLQNKFAQGDAGAYAGPETGMPYSWGPAISTLSWDGATDNPFDKHGNIVPSTDPSAKTPVHPYNPYDFFQTGHTYDNNVAIAGGTAEQGFRMSIGNLYQTGFIPKSRYQKTTFNISGQTKVSDKIGVSASITYIGSSNAKVQQGSNTSGIMLGLLRTTPTFDNSNGLGHAAADNNTAYLLPDGSQRSYRHGHYDNPYYTVNNNPSTSDLNRAFGFGQINYSATDWLLFNWRLGGDVYFQDDKSAFGSQSGAYHSVNGALVLTDYRNAQYNSDFTATFKHQFGDLNASLLLGQNYFTLQTNNRLAEAIGLNVPDFNDISNAASNVLNTQSDARKRTSAFYGDLELNWRSQIYLSATIRREESSTLPVQNDIFYYPSASLGWVFTELPALKGNSVLSFGKLRASFAQVGKDASIYALTTPFSAPLNFTDGFANTGVSVPYYFLSSTTTTIGNPLLRPEKTRSYEGGVDLNFLRDRITFNGTYYYGKTTDDILPAAISYTSGFAGKEFNGGIVTNHGIEITLNTTPIKTVYGLRWDVNFNWSHNVNTVVSLPGGLGRLLLAGFGAGEFESDAVPGQPYGVIYGNTTPHSQLMNLKSPLLINDNPNDQANVVGQPLGGGVGPNQVIGNPNPKWLGSVISNLSYKGLTLGVQVNVRHGGDMMNGTRGAIAFRGMAKETENRGTQTVIPGLYGHLDASGNVAHFDGGVEKPGPGTANTTKTTLDENYWQGVGNSVGGGQEVDIENGGYTRIRQVSLSYELPKSVLQKIKFTSLSLTVFATNPKVWTKYDGVDPETSLTGPSNSQGMDFFNNPGSKTYGVRLNLGL